MPDSFDGFCTLWPDADPGGRMKGMRPPTSHFLKCFQCIQFFHNLQTLRQQYASRTHNQKCASEMHHRLFGKAFRIRVKIFNQIGLKIIQKALK